MLTFPPHALSFVLPRDPQGLDQEGTDAQYDYGKIQTPAGEQKAVLLFYNDITLITYSEWISRAPLESYHTEYCFWQKLHAKLYI